MGVIVPSELLPALARGALVISGNERAARTLRLAWDTHQRDLGHRTWQPAQVLSWKSWTHSLWRRVLLDGRTSQLLLTPLQEARIWAVVLSEDPALSTLRSRENLASLAAEAWHRLTAFRGEDRLRRLGPSLSGDTASFARWAKSFQDLCIRESLLSESSLETELCRHLATGDLTPPTQELLITGVDDPTPAQQALLETLEDRGITLNVLDTFDPKPVGLVTAATEAEELRGCARWLQSQLHDNPQASLAVIVADLDRDRDTIASVFREILSPELEDITTEADAAPFEFSLGRALSHEPLVQVALDLLAWTVAPLPLESVSRLLLSPLFAARSQAELRARAEFDAFGLRADLRVRPEVAITDVLDLLRRFPHLPGLGGTLDRMASAQHQFDLRPRSFSEWTEWMRTWLALAHWGETFLTISSREFQVRERWESALEALATLDFSGETVTLPEALATLFRITSATVFAPEARNAPVQILGPREAAGSRFDAVWVLRAGELQWPPSASPHPLLPWSLQRELAMPGADPAREHATASHLTRRLAASAATVFFSYAGVTLEGGHQRAAAVVRDLSPRGFSLADLLAPDPPPTVIELESLEDPGTLSPLPPGEHRGGVRVLELQAACGFRAFAEMRLGSGDLRQRGLGLNAAERGSAVHHALEAFWSSVGSQGELRVMTSEARADLLDRAIERGLRRASSRSHDPWDRAYLEVQHARLKRLLDAWLDLELQRPDFIVKDQETRHKLQLSVLRLDVRIDRTDLVDGRQVVLDYKTGAANPSQWLGDRPDQPQVPLYALLASGAGAGEEAAAPLGGVGFAEVRSGKDMRLRGFSESPGMFRGKAARMDADSFPEQIDRWREVLESLANDFATGDARVRPKQFPATCTHCGQRLLCRVDAAAFEEAIEDDLSDAEDSLDG